MEKRDKRRRNFIHKIRLLLQPDIPGRLVCKNSKVEVIRLGTNGLLDFRFVC
jgi:hypothetical protein